jgi:hypothetical protein
MGHEIKNQTMGQHGGIIKPSSRPTSQPPRELVAEVEAEAAAENRSRERAKAVNPVKQMNDEAAILADWQEQLDPYVNADFIEKNPKGSEPIYMRLISFFWCSRPTGPNEVPDQNRGSYWLKVCAEPYFPVQLSMAQKRKQASQKSLYALPAGAAITATGRETFPSELLILSKFLKNYEPVGGFDISLLEKLSAPDVGTEEVKAPEPPPQPTILDLLGKMTTAIAAMQPKPAQQ